MIICIYHVSIITFKFTNEGGLSGTISVGLKEHVD